ncbi:hypothetical protein EUGRSUZ_H00410 [Eucalyptus grandis]|uniref:Uncharacterized protein n=2 Tax=Eucalyptus grandis TaxID=71139 RepID=A0ACC3JKP4_EUCGR|nr:hypothetical protein EUGRSUZ_H00410 [Eucalyptus grandis]
MYRSGIINTHPSTHTLTHPHTDSKNALPFINIIIFSYHHHFLLALGYSLPVPSRSVWRTAVIHASEGKRGEGKLFSWCWRFETPGTSLKKKHVGCSECHQAKNFGFLMIVIYM